MVFRCYQSSKKSPPFLQQSVMLVLRKRLNEKGLDEIFYFSLRVKRSSTSLLWPGQMELWN